MTDYVQPKLKLDAFHCPNCGSFSDQFWEFLYKSNKGVTVTDNRYTVGNCRRCNDITIWSGENMIFPLTGNAPMPNPDMTEEIKIDYNEARDIVSRSPRSACALLRLCIDKICDEKVKGVDLNEKIKKLVEQGLDPNITKA